MTQNHNADMAVSAHTDVLNNDYAEVIGLVERAHRYFLEVVKVELDKLEVDDINGVQGLMLFNIGDTEMTVGDLTLSGCYRGTNVSYNLKKMVENKYMIQERSIRDRRVVHVRLAEKGRKLRSSLQRMYDRHVEMLAEFGISNEDLQTVRMTLRRLEALWGGKGNIIPRHLRLE